MKLSLMCQILDPPISSKIMTAPQQSMYRKRLKNKHSSKRLSRDPRMATCRVDARGAGAHTLCIVYYVAIVIIFCVFERPFAHLDLRLRTCTFFFCCFTYYLQLRYSAYCMQTESHWLRMLASAQVQLDQRNALNRSQEKGLYMGTKIQAEMK